MKKKNCELLHKKWDSSQLLFVFFTTELNKKCCKVIYAVKVLTTCLYGF